MLPFYNVLIDFMNTPKVKQLTIVEILNELPFYNSLVVREISKTFKRYARSFSIEIIDKKDVLIQLNSSKANIKDLFGVLLREIEGFKYNITMNITLSKYKGNGDTDPSVYFNSLIKTVINYNFKHLVHKCFEELLFRAENWINEGSGWIIDQINGEYLNISKYSPLSGSTYIKLPDKLNHRKKGLINVENGDNKCFLWCHVRHLNLVDKHSTRITKEDRRIADELDYSGIDFPVSEKDYSEIENKNVININVSSYDGKLVYPVYVSDKNFDDSVDLLLIFTDDRSHYVYIKDFNRLMFGISKNENRKWFFKRCLQCFSSENVLVKHVEDCLVINGKQSVRLGEEFISFKNYSRQLPVPFKIYADFECVLRESERGWLKMILLIKIIRTLKSIKITYPCGFGYKVVCVDDKFSKDVVVYRGKDCVDKFYYVYA